MSDESTETTTTAPQPETLGDTLDRLVGDSEPEGQSLGAAQEGGKLGFSLAAFPTADVPSQNSIAAPVQLEQSGPSKLAVGQHKRIHTPIGLRSKHVGAKEPQAGIHIER